MAIIEGIFRPSIQVTVDIPVNEQILDYRTRPDVFRRVIPSGEAVTIQITEKEGLTYDKALEVGADGRATIETLITDESRYDDDATLGGYIKTVIGKRVPDQAQAVFIADTEDRTKIAAVYYHQADEMP